MCARCTASRLSVHVGLLRGAAGERQRVSSSCSVSPVEAIIARSTTFSSSRTLPGQE